LLWVNRRKPVAGCVVLKHTEVEDLQILYT
jgi:hypothetical protein